MSFKNDNFLEFGIQYRYVSKTPVPFGKSDKTKLYQKDKASFHLEEPEETITPPNFDPLS